MTSRPDIRPPIVSAAGVERAWLALGLGALAGLLVAYAWSHHLVDGTIGDNVANTLLGYDARATVLTGVTAGALFAFVTGLAGTFTACNIAALSALPWMLRERDSAGTRMRQALRPLGWLTLGALAVAMVYGGVGAAVGDRLPQLSEATTAGGMPVRLVQSSVVFGLIGAVMLYLAGVVLGVLPSRLPRDGARAVRAWMLVLGALIGAFLIGRPFPLFRTLFAYAAEAGSVIQGALVFALQTLGNIALLAVAFLLLAGPGVGVQRWLARHPDRAARITGAALAAAGSFTFVYWVVRIPARFGYGWFPTAPWA